MTSRQFIRWAKLHERRSGHRLTWPLAILGGATLAGLVASRPDATGASHLWLAATIVAHAFAYLRVPFHIYWRSDAALLAQLPIEGKPLFDAALLRCVRAAAATGVACAIGAVPLALLSDSAVAEATRQITATPIAGGVPALTPLSFALRHLAIDGALSLTAGLLVPAIVVWAASLLVGEPAAVAGALHGRQVSASAARSSAGAVLGAIPGAAGVLVISSVIVGAPWLTGRPDAAGATVATSLAIASVIALVIARRASGIMGTILRDVSALDRQRLATLEIRPPTAIERTVARLIGAAGLPYRKDARLVRRRYPMAFALGGLVLVILIIIGFARPADPMPWLITTIAAAALYGIILSRRLHRPPIELPRLISTLPIASSAVTRAKVTWASAWWLVFVIAPATFAIVRQADRGVALATLLASTLAVLAAALPRREHV